MRIAMLSYHTCPLATLGGKDTGGMNVYVRDLTRQLGRMGVHVDVFTRSQDEHVPHVLHDLGYGNRIVHIPAGPEHPLPKQELAAYLDAFVQGILDFSASKHIRYDLIHSHYWMSGIAARTLKDAWQVPVVHMFHTLGHMKNRIAGFGEAEGAYRINGENEVIRIADRIIAATPAELAQLQWLYHAPTEKIVVIPPGVDLSRFYPIPKDEAKAYTGSSDPDDDCSEHNILFVGRIEPLKGIDVLIRAIALLEREQAALLAREPLCVGIIGGDPDSALEVGAGLTPEMARLQALREEYGVQEAINFLGKRGQDILPYYYSAADLVVMPSHYESFGMVALEAMACGTPVVASQVGGLAFLIRDGITGYLFPGDDPVALAERIRLLISDRAQRQQMGAQAAEYAKQYSWERIAAELVEVYRSLL